MEIQEIIEQLTSVELFEELKEDHEKLKQIALIVQKEEYLTGEYFFKEKELGHKIYILVSGKVKVCKQTKNQEEYIIAEMDAKDHVFFGEIALVDNDMRSSSIQATENCIVLSIERKAFQQLGKKYPEICLPITQFIAKKMGTYLRKANQDILLLFNALVTEIEQTGL